MACRWFFTNLLFTLLNLSKEAYRSGKDKPPGCTGLGTLDILEVNGYRSKKDCNVLNSRGNGVIAMSGVETCNFISMNSYRFQGGIYE
jgi:hypothetical protein